MEIDTTYILPHLLLKTVDCTRSMNQDVLFYFKTLRLQMMTEVTQMRLYIWVGGNE